MNTTRSLFDLPTLILLIMAYLGLTLPVVGHEYWLQPLDFRPEIGSNLQVELRDGEDFAGFEIGYFPKRIERFDYIQGRLISPVSSQSGDFPALSMRVENDGLMVLTYETKPRVVQFNLLSHFIDFADKKGFSGVEERHQQRKTPSTRFNVIYKRFCKSLLGVGSAIGTDHQTGSEFEFVALKNPYRDDLSEGLAVTLLYRGQPQPNRQIRVFARGPDDVVKNHIQHSNAQGIVVIATKPAHNYMLDAALLREPNETFGAQNNVIWETLWVSMTFATP